jgi:hypothetical protein
MLPLPQFILEMLKEHRTRQEESQRAAGAAWQGHDLLFCNKYGSYLRPDRVRKQFKKLLEDAGLPHMRFHDLRHSAATILMSMDVLLKIPLSEKMSLLGHLGGLKRDLVAQLLQASDCPALGSLGSLLLGVVWPQFAVGLLLFEQMIDDHQDAMSQGHDRFLPSHALFESLVIRPQVGAFAACCRVGSLNEGLTEPGIAFAALAAQAFAGTDLGCRTEPRPGD